MARRKRHRGNHRCWLCGAIATSGVCTLPHPSFDYVRAVAGQWIEPTHSQPWQRSDRLSA